MIWFLVIVAIVGWAVALAALIVCGLLTIGYAARIAEEIDMQRPFIAQTTKVNKFGPYGNNGKSV